MYQKLLVMPKYSVQANYFYKILLFYEITPRRYFIGLSAKSKKASPLYKAEFTTPPTRATPKPSCPIRLNI